MKRTTLFFVVSAVLGSPALAADRAPAAAAHDDALGSGLAALWRESNPDALAAHSESLSSGMTLAGQSTSLLLPPWALPPGGLAMAPFYRLAQSKVSLPAGPGLTGQLDVFRAATTARGTNQPLWSSAGAAFDSGTWRAFASHERAQDWSGPGAGDEGWRLGAAYRLRGAQISAGWERLRHDVDAVDARQQAWWIGVSQRVGDGALRLNFARAADISGGRTSGLGGARQLALGYEHGLSPQTAIYAFYTRLSNDPNGLFRLGGGEVENALSATSRTGLSLGVRHSF